MPSTVLGSIQLSSFLTMSRGRWSREQQIPSKSSSFSCSSCRVELIESLRQVLRSVTENDIKDMWCFNLRKYIQTLTYGFDWVVWSSLWCSLDYPFIKPYFITSSSASLFGKISSSHISDGIKMSFQLRKSLAHVNFLRKLCEISYNFS